jgi:hypothetical protein
VRKRVIVTFVTELGERLRNGNFDVKLDWPLDNALDKGRSLQARRDHWAPNAFLKIAGETWGPNNVRLSFCGVPSTDANFGEYQRKLADLGSGGWSDPAEGRPWQVNLSDIFEKQWTYSNWTSPAAIREMGGRSKGRFAEKLAEAFARAGGAIGS